MTNIAFIGLGNMGGPMAANLVVAGHRVTGFDLVPAALEAAAASGVTIAATASEAVAQADVIITMLPSGRHVLAAYEGLGAEAGLLASARPDALFIESSTISVDDARRAHQLAEAAGMRSVDAPVSGGVVGATAATLTFMVGGAAADFEFSEPFLSSMGSRIVHCGAPGNGQAAKICNNLILGSAMIAVSEAFVLGEKLGLTNQALFDVASTASGQCWALTTNCPVPGPVATSPANREFQPGFAGALMAKDLGLAVEALESTGVEADIGRLAEAIYRQFAADGGGGLDFSAIIDVIRERSTKESA